MQSIPVPKTLKAHSYYTFTVELFESVNYKWVNKHLQKLGEFVTTPIIIIKISS